MTVEESSTGTEETSQAVAEAIASEEEQKVRSVNQVNQTALARNLYQTGLDLGLTPAEAALLVVEIELPPVSKRPR